MRLTLYVLLLTLAAGSPAPAATFLVTKEADDDGACSPDDCALREAVLAANASPGLDRIDVPPGTYQLSLVGSVEENLGATGDLDISDDLELVGSALAPVVIVGDGTDRVIQVANEAEVSIENVVVTGGAAESNGGGIRVDVSTLTLANCILEDNETLVGGGGLALLAADTTIENTTIRNNRAPFGRGGGAFMIGPSFVRVEVINSTVSGNSAVSGGGIYFVSRAAYDVVNTTFADNTSVNTFGEAVVGDESHNLTYNNSLFSNNNCGYIGTDAQTNGHNMEGPSATCFLPAGGDARGVPDIMLGPLADNGGPTPTHALLSGSPAVDAAADADCPSTDQRGSPRPIDGDHNGAPACDIGAFELRGAGVLAIPALGPSARIVLVLLLALSAVAALRRRREAGR